ncbi:DUF3556 domain-containing protein [Brevibacterium daeguense]|uniref:DUF3556 domain-containing protein n=1 Tax=Brevibacterium daeguense TaxID=909936 RepID=A0ABP8EJP6_9MICO|nr:DUF3556 domain-containing protein [Brevibacterium daeguense]
MGFRTPDLPAAGPAAVVRMPFQERMKTLSQHWGEYGFGVPKNILMFYVIKMAVYMVLGVLIVGLTTPALGGFAEFTSWWTEPIVYLKLMVFTILFEITGWSSSSGPMAFKVKPPIGGILYFARRGTLRVPPWPDKVPLTGGDHRTLWDVALYWAILANLVFLLVHPGARIDLVPNAEAGLLPAWALLTYLGLLGLMGLRDKVVFLISRAEQYPPILLAFAVLTSFTDMIVAAKIVIVVVWVGAAVSKLGRHFSPAVAAMMANTAWVPSRAIKRALYKDFPRDLRPSKFTTFMAHVPGTILEGLLPLVLLFSTDRTITAIALVGIIAFHVFIISTIPLAVPLEWNIFFIFSAIFLFWNFPAQAGYGVFDFSSPWIAAAVVILMVLPPIVGNIRPDWISFLVSYRQYAGNWASAVWAFRDKETELKIEQHIIKSNAMHATQLEAAYGEDLGEMFVQKTNAWRSMHSMGRALHSLLRRHTENIDTYRIREAETVCSALVGWQFGDGHLHDERLITAVQKRCNYEPGDLVVVFTESEPIHRNYTEYRVIDAALGVVERGWYWTKDSSEAQPWLPNGPIPHRVTWTLPGYVAPGDSMLVAQSAGATDVADAVEVQQDAAEVVDSAAAQAGMTSADFGPEGAQRAARRPVDDYPAQADTAQVAPPTDRAAFDGQAAAEAPAPVRRQPQPAEAGLEAVAEPVSGDRDRMQE